MNKIEELYIKL